MSQVSDSIQALRIAANASHQSTILSLEQLSDKMQDLSDLSTGQSDTINATCNAILELLTQQLPVKPLQSAAKAFQHESISPRGMDYSQEVESEGKHTRIQVMITIFRMPSIDCVTSQNRKRRRHFQRRQRQSYVIFSIYSNFYSWPKKRSVEKGGKA